MHEYILICAYCKTKYTLNLNAAQSWVNLFPELVIGLKCENVQNFASPKIIYSYYVNTDNTFDQRIVNNIILKQQYINKWCARFRANMKIMIILDDFDCLYLSSLVQYDLGVLCFESWDVVVKTNLLCDWACMCVSKTRGSTMSCFVQHHWPVSSDSSWQHLMTGKQGHFWFNFLRRFAKWSLNQGQKANLLAIFLAVPWPVEFTV